MSGNLQSPELTRAVIVREVGTPTVVERTSRSSSNQSGTITTIRRAQVL
jgi:hypothetical protein